MRFDYIYEIEESEGDVKSTFKKIGLYIKMNGVR